MDLKKLEKILVALFLLIFFSINFYLAITDSQTIDEGPHISGGYSYLKTGDYRINPEHPPLVKLLAGLPLLFYKPSLPINHSSWQNYDEWEFGRQFLYYNTRPADTIILIARLPMIILGLILGLFIFKWAKELFGGKAGLLALFLYSLSPNFLAQSHLVTTDVPLTLFFLLSIYYFGKYLKIPNRKNLIYASLAFAGAILTKYSALILVPILVLLYFINWLLNRGKTNLSFKKFIFVFLVFLGVTVLSTLILYGFEFKKPISDPRVGRLYEERLEIIESGQGKNQPLFVKPLLKYGDPETPIGRFIYNFAQKFPVPAYSYWRGLFSVLSHNYWGHGSYLLGRQGLRGWWYYFIVAFFIKTPLTTIILLIFALIFFIYKFKVNPVRNSSGALISNGVKQKLFFQNKFWLTVKNLKFDYFLLIIPPLIYFLWSLTSHINLGVRHIFPVYPFIFILVSSLVLLRFKKPSLNKIHKIIFTALLIFYLITNIKIFPHYLSYFNEAIGGPSKGAQYLLDSNIDWGQDFKRLKKYVEENNIDEYYACNFGSLVTQYYVGQREIPMPFSQEIEKFGPKKGYYIISVGALYDQKDYFSWLRKYIPLAKVGYSIYVYKF